MILQDLGIKEKVHYPVFKRNIKEYNDEEDIKEALRKNE